MFNGYLNIYNTVKQLLILDKENEEAYLDVMELCITKMEELDINRYHEFIEANKKEIFI